MVSQVEQLWTTCGLTLLQEGIASCLSNEHHTAFLDAWTQKSTYEWTLVDGADFSTRHIFHSYYQNASSDLYEISRTSTASWEIDLNNIDEEINIYRTISEKNKINSEYFQDGQYSIAYSDVEVEDGYTYLYSVLESIDTAIIVSPLRINNDDNVNPKLSSDLDDLE